MDKKFKQFTNSQIAFSKLWDKIKPANGAQIAYIDAVVNYQTDVTSLNKNIFVKKIVLNNSNNNLGGKIDLPTDIFNEDVYHGSFYAQFQDYTYNNYDFVIAGKANSQKNYNCYKIILSDIQVNVEE